MQVARNYNIFKWRSFFIFKTSGLAARGPYEHLMERGEDDPHLSILIEKENLICFRVGLIFFYGSYL